MGAKVRKRYDLLAGILRRWSTFGGGERRGLDEERSVFEGGKGWMGRETRDGEESSEELRKYEQGRLNSWLATRRG